MIADRALAIIHFDERECPWFTRNIAFRGGGGLNLTRDRSGFERP